MRLQRYADLNARVIGEGEERVVVLLHGFGAPGDDLVSLARAISAPPGTRFIFPEAPISLSMGFGESRAWWMIDLMHLQSRLMSGELDLLKREVPKGLDEARTKLDAFLDAVQSQHQIAGSRIILGGFSQGAMLSLDVALRSDRSLGGLILFSGTIVALDRWQPRFAVRKDLPIVQSHGRMDPVLPFAFAEELQAMLSSAGYDHTWVPFMGGHEIPPQAIAAASSFLSRHA